MEKRTIIGLVVAMAVSMILSGCGGIYVIEEPTDQWVILGKESRISNLIEVAQYAVMTSRQWQRLQQAEPGGIEVWWDIPGATTETYTFTARSEDDGAKFRCKIIYTKWPDYGIPHIYHSNEATLTVLDLDPIADLSTQMIFIPSGSFEMGSNGVFMMENSKPVHTVSLKYPFFISKHEVTQALYDAVMNARPSVYKRIDSYDYPVENVSWNDAIDFCKALTDLTGVVYSLPTEAEWEYACRAGTTTPYSFGDDSYPADNHAWYLDDSDNKVHPVERKHSNNFGLYDMGGNVNEWCLDSWHENYIGAPNDGSAWLGIDKKDDRKVVRGGGYSDPVEALMSASRGWVTHDTKQADLGFRIVAHPLM